MSISIPKPVALVIFDGFGYLENTTNNAIKTAKTPNFDHIWHNSPRTLISASGGQVGLPKGQMGNSEVGHLSIGAGRIVPQDYARIEQAIQSEEFFHNQLLCEACDQAIDGHFPFHIMGLLSPGGVHSHESQIHAMVKLAARRGVKRIYVHAFLDGRDTPPKSALESIERLNQLFDQYGVGKIVSLIGRFYAMDRDNRWERTQQAYELLTKGIAKRRVADAIDGLHMAYNDGETDEFVAPTLITTAEGERERIDQDSIVCFMNYRADRARQLTRVYSETNFSPFDRCYGNGKPQCRRFISLTQYDEKLQVDVSFPPILIKNTLGECLAKHGLKQLRIAETEKYAHVTFFFNGGQEQPFQGEQRLLIPSPKVATYDLKPEMSAVELTDQFIANIKSQRYDCIICNYANADMVGHTGQFLPTVAAIECLDQCLGRLLQALKHLGGELLLTADHGNAEKMFNEQTQQPHTAHTTEPVPFIYVGREAKVVKGCGALEDIAPTVLYLMAINKPSEMTGKSLVELL